MHFDERIDILIEAGLAVPATNFAGYPANNSFIKIWKIKTTDYYFIHITANKSYIIGWFDSNGLPIKFSDLFVLLNDPELIKIFVSRPDVYFRV